MRFWRARDGVPDSAAAPFSLALRGGGGGRRALSRVLAPLVRPRRRRGFRAARPVRDGRAGKGGVAAAAGLRGALFRSVRPARKPSRVGGRSGVPAVSAAAPRVRLSAGQRAFLFRGRLCHPVCLPAPGGRRGVGQPGLRVGGARRGGGRAAVRPRRSGPGGSRTGAGRPFTGLTAARSTRCPRAG